MHPLAPNVFDMVPRGMLGAVYERDGKSKGWQRANVQRFCEAYAAGTCPGVETIFNSGVMLMDAGMRDTLLDPTTAPGRSGSASSISTACSTMATSTA